MGNPVSDLQRNSKLERTRYLNISFTGLVVDTAVVVGRRSQVRMPLMAAVSGRP